MGIVEEIRDPEKLGRLKVRVPAVFGASGEIGTDDLPWAIPFGLPAGGSSASGGISFLPERGDQVAVMFMDGEPEKPVWGWAMQTKAQSKTFPLHSYGEDKNPDRAVFTRYGHSLEIRQDTLVITTNQGYAVVIEQDPESPRQGSVMVRTPLGNFVKLDDVADGITINANQDIAVETGDEHRIQAAVISQKAFRSDIVQDAAKAISQTAGTKFEVSAPTVKISAQTISLEAGGRKLSITAGGFNFT